MPTVRTVAAPGSASGPRPYAPGGPGTRAVAAHPQPDLPAGPGKATRTTQVPHRMEPSR
ncbi:hypothetical protein [Streptomyces sp. NPDC002537]